MTGSECFLRGLCAESIFEQGHNALRADHVILLKTYDMYAAFQGHLFEFRHAILQFHGSGILLVLGFDDRVLQGREWKYEPHHPPGVPRRPGQPSFMMPWGPSDADGVRVERRLSSSG